MNPSSSDPAATGSASLALATDAQASDAADTVARARAFAEPLLVGESLGTAENTLAHADAVCAILASIGGSPAMQAGAYLVYACEHLNRPQEVLAKRFGDNLASLAMETAKLIRVQQQARAAQAIASTSAPLAQTKATQTENVRKMLLAFSRDLRVVMLRLASRLQTLRHYAASKRAVPPSLARESLQVFAPLANRLGIWECKWELEDLSLRLQDAMATDGIHATVQGRPKHIYSIVKKMRGKSLGFAQVYDIRALRIIVPTLADCYQALAHVHSAFTPVVGEFDDYIAKPKANGYQSLHTVVRDSAGLPVEIQIRTPAMHAQAEHGVAAHWVYKEAGTKGYAGVSASGAYDAKIAVLRQLLAWERDLSGQQEAGLFEDRIYVLTPDAAIVELPQGATAVDFAYSVHTDLGHRCRGARVDGAMVALNTPLRNGQTVEVSVVKEGGPSRDWLNAELGFLVSHRARAKVRAWFNALATHETVARGREAVEKLLQREGKTSVNLEELAGRLGFDAADDLFEVVGKDEFSLRTIELVLRPAVPAPAQADSALLKRPTQPDRSGAGGVLVVGVGSLLTQLASCCKPAPPDAICGFVTRGKGVSVHRADCSNLREMLARNGERLIEVQWGPSRPGAGAPGAVYPVDVAIEAADRQGLLRDISEVFAKEKMNLIGVQTQSLKSTAWMTFTVEVADAIKLQRALAMVRELEGVRSARRR